MKCLPVSFAVWLKEEPCLSKVWIILLWYRPPHRSKLNYSCEYAIHGFLRVILNSMEAPTSLSWRTSQFTKGNCEIGPAKSYNQIIDHKSGKGHDSNARSFRSYGATTFAITSTVSTWIITAVSLDKRAQRMNKTLICRNTKLDIRVAQCCHFTKNCAVLRAIFWWPYICLEAPRRISVTCMR